MNYLLLLVIIGTLLPAAILGHEDEYIVDLSHTLGYNGVNPPWNTPFNLTNTLLLDISEGIK